MCSHPVQMNYCAISRHKSSQDLSFIKLHFPGNFAYFFHVMSSVVPVSVLYYFLLKNVFLLTFLRGSEGMWRNVVWIMLGFGALFNTV